MNKDWQKNFPGAITLCDKDFIIIYMNEKAINTFKEDGGEKLIGKNLLECHNEKSKLEILKIRDSGEPKAYTIEKKGIKKLIYQAPLFGNSEYSGMVELSLEIPFDMSHFKRD